MKTYSMGLSKAAALALLVGSSQQAATFTKNTEWPLFPGQSGTAALQASNAACDNTNTPYFNLRGGGVYGASQYYTGGAVAALPSNSA